MKVRIIRSGTWMSDFADLDTIESCLNEALEHMESGDSIINIETKEHNGLSRFWIYLNNGKGD